MKRLVTLVILFTLTLCRPVMAVGSDDNAVSAPPAHRLLTHQESGDTYLIEESARIQTLPRPSVALALGGGGARALVNVGVLKALEEEDVPIDLVVGTSMGAIVAVMYGSGIPVDQIEQLVTKVSLPAMFDLGFPFNRSLLVTKGLNDFIESAAPTHRLEDFPIPTALLSFDLKSGVKYVHTTGPISTAMQGPYAIPLFFRGQQLGDHFLIDAGIQELTPSQTAKVLGADVVIATTAFDRLPYDDYDSSVRSWTRLINLIKEDYSRPVIDRYSDVVVASEVGDYSFMDFHLAKEFIALGYRNTKQHLPAIKEALEKKGVQLRPSPVRARLDMAKVLQDVRYDRLALGHGTVNPRFYFGRKVSYFGQGLLPESSTSPQYGVEARQGRTRANLLIDGSADRVEAQFRQIGLTPGADLILQARKFRGARADWEAALRAYPMGQSVTVGSARLGDASYLHLKGTYGWAGESVSFQGETDLLVPATTEGPLQYVASHQGSVRLSPTWALHPKVVVADSEALDAPQVYHGSSESGVNASTQAALELVHSRTFPYSLEVLQLIQVTGIDSSLFVDYRWTDQAEYALGAAVGLDSSMLGLKPSRLGAYLSYDLTREEARTGLEVDLRF